MKSMITKLAHLFAAATVILGCLSLVYALVILAIMPMINLININFLTGEIVQITNRFPNS